MKYTVNILDVLRAEPFIISKLVIECLNNRRLQFGKGMAAQNGNNMVVDDTPVVFYCAALDIGKVLDTMQSGSRLRRRSGRQDEVIRAQKPKCGH